jgi:DNA ligase (NAD+)
LLSDESLGLAKLFSLSTEELETTNVPGVQKNASLVVKKQLGVEEVSYFFGEHSPSILTSGLLFKLALARQTDLWRFLPALNIRLIGPEVAKPLAGHFDGLLPIFESEESVLARIPGVGQAAAKSIGTWWQDATNRRLVQSWIESGVKPVSEKQEINFDGPLSGMTVLVTGTLKTLDRDQAKQAIVRAGGRSATGVSGTLDFAVIGDKAGPSKLSKLHALGITLLDEEEFLQILAS